MLLTSHIFVDHDHDPVFPCALSGAVKTEFPHTAYGYYIPFRRLVAVAGDEPSVYIDLRAFDQSGKTRPR